MEKIINSNAPRCENSNTGGEKYINYLNNIYLPFVTEIVPTEFYLTNNSKFHFLSFGN